MKYVVFISKGHISSMVSMAMYGSVMVPSWASEASPTLGCSIEISRDIYIYVVGMSVVC